MNTIARLFVGIGTLVISIAPASAQTRPGSAATAPAQRPPARGPVQPATNLQSRPPVRTAQVPQSNPAQPGQVQAGPQQQTQQLPPGGVPLGPNGQPQNQQLPPGGVPLGSAQPGARQPNGAPPVAGQAPRAVVKGLAPKAPFTLTPAEQQSLDNLLANWERQSDKVKNYKCTFNRWEVNKAFGPPEKQYALTQGTGEIQFKAPDHGAYEIADLAEWDKQKKAYAKRSEKEGFDHWMCDGTAIYEFNAPAKKLIERQLAPEMRGKAISDGPLPFIFGAKADQLKRRYWLRDVTPKEDDVTAKKELPKQIWLEAWPKFQADAANYHHAIVVLNTRDFMPSALSIIQPNGQDTQDYEFVATKVNDPLAVFTFDKPRCPWGWTREVVPAPGSEQAAPPASKNPAEQAERPTATQARRPAGTAVK